MPHAHGSETQAPAACPLARIAATEIWGWKENFKHAARLMTTNHDTTHDINNHVQHRCLVCDWEIDNWDEERDIF